VAAAVAVGEEGLGVEEGVVVVVEAGLFLWLSSQR
jgi:hypothetical protein